MGKKILLVLKVLLVAYAISGILLLVAAFAMYKLELGENPVRIFILVIYGVSTIVSGLIYAKKKSEKRLLNGAMIGALYFIILSVVSFIANHGFYEDIKKAGISMIICVLGGILGGIFS